MKSKNLILVAIIAIAIIFVFVLVARHSGAPKKSANKQPAEAQKADKAKSPVKKAISKNMGGLTVKMVDLKGGSLPLKVRAFKASDSRSSIYETTLTANNMSELTPGDYDIEIDTFPAQMIHKNVRVAVGKENTVDIGCVTGAITVKALNASKNNAGYTARIYYGKNGSVNTVTNKQVLLMPGTYTAELYTIPKQSRNNIKVEAGKETVAEFDCATGSLMVRAADADNKEQRYNFRARKADSPESFGMWQANKKIELIGGIYDIDIISNPVQTKKGVNVTAGQETNIEFTVPTIVPPVYKPPVVTVPAAAKNIKPAKKR